MKMMIFGRRRGGMTLRELHAYMLDVHGAMVVRYIAAQRELAPRRYAQNHVFDSACRVPGAAADPFALNRDFVTQVGFDTPAQAMASLDTPFYRDELRPDEDRFVDQPSVVQIPVAERELKPLNADSRDRIKLFLLLQRAASVTHADFMVASDAALAGASDDGSFGVSRWVRNEAIQRPGPAAPVDVVHELWLANEEAARSAAARLRDIADRDLSASITPGSTCLLLAHEHVLFAGHAA